MEFPDKNGVARASETFTASSSSSSSPGGEQGTRVEASIADADAAVASQCESGVAAMLRDAAAEGGAVAVQVLNSRKAYI